MKLSDKPLFWEMDKSDDGRYWFWEITHNELFSWQPEDSFVRKEIIPTYTENNTEYTLSHTLLKIYKTKLLLIPRGKSRFIIHDIISNTDNYVELPDEINKWIDTVDSLFSAFVLKDDFLYLAGGNIPYIARLNLKEEKIDKYIKLFPEAQISNNNPFFKDIQIISGKIYVCCADLNQIFIVDPDDFTYSNIIVEGVKRGFTAIRWHESKMILFPRYADPIAVMHFDDGRWEIWNEYPKDFAFDNSRLRELDFPIIVGSSAIIFPAMASDVLIVNLNNGRIIKEENINSYLRNTTDEDHEKISKVAFAKLIDDKIFILLSSTRALLIYDVKKHDIEVRTITFTEDDINAYNASKIKGNIIDENQEFTLKDYLRAIPFV